MHTPVTYLQQPDYILIPAAGSGSRARQDKPKQFIDINGKILLLHTIENLRLFFPDTPIGVIVQKDCNLNNIQIIPTGGAERQYSIFNALKYLVKQEIEIENILIHDAARPYVSANALEDLLTAFQNNPYSVTLANKVTSSMRRSNGEVVPRDDLWMIQTPQMFNFASLLEAHKAATSLHTDDTSLMDALGYKTTFVESPATNIKITTPEDIDMAHILLREIGTAPQTRTGQGFDVHAFNMQSLGPIKLGGVSIDHPHALAGHSDADVVIHALIDALLGACTMGDIGEHFPPSDDKWKNADSQDLLKQIVSKLPTHSITNIDITIICEAPKITPHKRAMATTLCEILGCATDIINIKATTTEGLGFTGRKEGIAAQALVTVLLP